MSPPHTWEAKRRWAVWRLQQAEANFSTTAILTIYTSNHGNSSAKATSCYYDTAFRLSYSQEVQGLSSTMDIFFYAKLFMFRNTVKTRENNSQPRFNKLLYCSQLEIECFHYLMIFHPTLFLIWLITLYPIEIGILYSCQYINRKLNKHT